MQVSRPFQLAIGVFLGLLSLLLAISLVLTNIDRALHSSLSNGYSLQNSSLPNPLDLTLIAAQAIFPLDYILYTALVVFLVSCSTAGLTSLGIRCCCLALYKIRSSIDESHNSKIKENDTWCSLGVTKSSKNLIISPQGLENTS